MSTASQSVHNAHAAERDALLERIVDSAAATFSIFAIHIGDQLGFYEALAQDGGMTSRQLASRSGAHERYVREWLEQQTVTGILRVEDASAPAEARVFYLPAGHAEALADRDSLNYIAPLAQVSVGAVSAIDTLLVAFRSGGGIGFDRFGRNLRDGQARMNRAAFLQELGPKWLPAMPDVDTRLRGSARARVADIGCGCGWSSIGMASAYPNVVVHGFDSDEASIDEARRNASAYEVSDRVRFESREAGASDLAGGYDLVTAFECVHDMSDPVGALKTMRRLAGDNGAVLVMDERVGESFSPGENEIEPLMYGFSVMHCLPCGMAEQPSAGTGTVMRPEVLRKYAKDAEFREVEVLPIENFFFRFYRLRQ